MKVGFETPIRPIAPIEENMTRIDAGALSFGVEHRLLNDAIVAEHMANHSAEQVAANRPNVGGGAIDDSGVSIHVFGADGHEYLRFDCFDDGPHYHYIAPGAETQLIVAMDRAANGDPLDWTLSCLRGRLAQMLQEAGGAQFAERGDPALVAGALDKVEATAKRVVA
jgi:hypothetical protein